MELSIFCPLCQRKNSVDATHCAYCGVQFVVDRADSFTTEQISKIHSAQIGPRSRCAEHLPDLPENALSLFVMNEPDPIVIEEPTQIVIGRDIEGTTIAALDLSEYGALEMGISRQHVQISARDGMFSVVDLGSTNGSWLNQRRMIAGKPYRLQSNDQLLLGQLRLYVCFHSEEEVEEVVIHVTDTTVSAQSGEQLTPQFLAETIIPFLQIVIEVQRVLDASRGTITPEVHINALSAVRNEAITIVSLDGAAEAVQMIEQWVVPFRKLFAVVSKENDNEANVKLQRGLDQLAKKMLHAIATDSAGVDVDTHRPSLVSSLAALVSSPLKLSAENN
jgi:hypothetical protein